MRVHVVSNLSDGGGLARDARLLEALLGAWGHEVRCWPMQRTKPLPPADLVVFLERIVPAFLDAAPARWLIPNPEWWPDGHDALLERIDRVLCKTADAARLFSARHRDVVLVGFTADDRLDAAVPRARRFLHVAGASRAKGTAAVLEAWDGLSHPLDVVGDVGAAPAGVRVHRRLDDAALRALQNACRFHLCPSAYEGFGHTLHEARSVGACVVTTDAPPMRDWGAVRVPAEAGPSMGLAETWRVTAAGVRDAVDRCLALGDAALDDIAAGGRGAFLRERADFAARLREIFEGGRR